MILKLNIKLYFSEFYICDEVIACQTCTTSTHENFTVLKMTKKSTLFKLKDILMQYKQLIL